MLGEDPALLAAFLDESRESLDGIEAKLIDLDHATDLRQEIDAIFRPVHTLKGNAPFFGFMKVQRLAHALETILDQLRKDRLARSPLITEALLAGLDGLRGCIERLHDGGAEVEDAAAFSALVERLDVIGTGNRPRDPWERIFAELDGIERQGDQFDPATQSRLAHLHKLLDEVRGLRSPAACSSESSDSVVRLRKRLSEPLPEPLDQAAGEAVIAELRALRAANADPEQVALLDHVLATCEVFMGAIGFDDMLRQQVVECLETLSSAPTMATGSGSTVAPRNTTPSSERRARSDSESQGKSMRVSEAAVDGFLAHVGDLLVIGDQMEYLQRRLAESRVDVNLAREMRQAVVSFSALSSELQRSIMAVRRVPVRALLQKAPRLVHDIAKAVGKEIDVQIEGEAQEVDKGRLDLLDGPLTHIVRNCADHGIELPDVRTAAGKPSRGKITLRAMAEDGWFILEVSDDGKGLDLDAIRRKGESLGLLSAGAEMNEKTIIDLIFASGLSTAEKVTDVSGRGVGMDVVKRQIDEAGGSITVSTVRGRGTNFRLSLPATVSTQIISAFLVRDSGGIFALPLDLIRESFVDAVVQGTDGIGVVLRHERVMPVAPLGQVLGQTISGEPSSRRTFVTIEHRGRAVAVTVDETLGVRRLVIRPLSGGAVRGTDGRFKGAALLGDGRLALVIDPDRLLELISVVASHG